MTSYFAAGNAANAIYMAHTLVATPTLDSNFPAAHLLSNNLGELVRFSAGDADAEIVIDLNMFYDGSFEIPDAGSVPEATDPKGRRAWQIESATPSVATAVSANPDSTTKELRLNASGEAVYYDVEVVAGNTYRLEGDFYGHGSSDAQVELINLDTNKYLNSSGGWNTAQTYVDTNSAASWSSFAETFTVEAAADGGSDRMTLRLRLSKSGANSNPVYFDDLSLVPDPNTVALLGARYGAGIDAELWSGTTSAGSTTNEVTLTRNALRTFATFTSPSTPRRWYRLLFDGGPSVRYIDLAGLWLFERKEFDRSVAAPVTTTHKGAQRRQQGLEHLSTNLGATARLEHTLRWNPANQATLDQVIEQLYLGSRRAGEPSLVIPDTSRTDRVIQGRVDVDLAERYLTPSSFRVDGVTFIEDPMPARVEL